MRAERGAGRDLRAGCRLLVVDDDRDFADSLGELLRLEGFEVDQAHSLVTARARLAERRPAIALIDIRLRDGSGLDLVAEVNAGYPEVTCIVMTAYASIDTAVATLHQQAYDYLRKPFYPEDLLATIDRCLERRALMAERDQAEAALKSRNQDLEALNRRLQGLVGSMRKLSSCTTLRGLSECLLEQAVELTGAASGAVTLRSGETAALDPPPGQSVTRRHEFALLGSDRRRIGSIVIGESAERALGAEDRELVQILVSYASEVVYLLQALDRVTWSELRLRDIIDHSPSLISLQDLAGRFLIVNKRFEAWHGIAATDAIGRTAASLFPAEVRRLYAPLGPGELDRQAEAEIELTFADGSRHSLLTTRFPVHAVEGGGLIGTGTIATDVTERRDAEARLRQAQKMEALGQLTGGVAHDFNNLLAVIQGNLSLLHAALGSRPELIELLDDAMAAAVAGADLTHRLLAFGRRQTLYPQPSDAGALLTQLVRVLERTLGAAITIRLDLAADLWPILVDRSLLETSILNLALNARDAMPEGGVLDIAAANVATCGDGAGFVEVVVTDTGSGMTPDVLARAPQPFFTTKAKGQGTGLGLSMVHGFVQQSGGSIALASAPGAGTTIRLRLPRAPVPPGQGTAGGVGGPPAAGTGAVILVVEDQPDVGRLIARILAQEGYVLLQASDGASALQLLAGRTDIALLLTDIALAGGMSGIELARAARADRPGMRLLYTSGYAPAALDGTAADLPAPLVPKPFQAEELLAAVRRALRAAPPA
jgi:PAS domain S-box-containing protein